jgi:hypothetical protein
LAAEHPGRQGDSLPNTLTTRYATLPGLRGTPQLDGLIPVWRLDAAPRVDLARFGPPALPSPRAMADTGKIAKNLERFAQAVASHDRENPTHTAHGIGLAHFDMERLGFDEGEEILPGITIHADSGVTGNFRVLCDGEHDEGESEVEHETVQAVATRSLPAIAPGTQQFPSEQ